MDNMNKRPNFYKDRICLNVLTQTLENAQKLYEVSGGYILLGLLTKLYNSDEEYLENVRKYQKKCNNAISVGLGSGDPSQSMMVSRVSSVLQPQHVNQVFSGVGYSRALLGQQETFINALVSPTGKIGYVNIATGPLSSKGKPVNIKISSAIDILKDMGASSIKYFPMDGLKYIDEYKEICRICAEKDFPLEPTGGITTDNFEEVIRIPYESGVKKIIPHVYNSIIDKEKNLTRYEDVSKLMMIIKKIII